MIYALSFIRLADYLIVGTLHVLAVNSVQSLFNYYTEQLENTPSLADIQATNKMPEKTDEDGKPEEKPVEKKEISSLKKETTMSIPMHPGQVYIVCYLFSIIFILLNFKIFQEEEKEEEKVIPPLYISEFVLDIDSLTFRPDLDQFREIVSEIMQHFKETLLQVENLVPDKYFDAFTRQEQQKKFFICYLLKIILFKFKTNHKPKI